jgi:hypothetical protein
MDLVVMLTESVDPYLPPIVVNAVQAIQRFQSEQMFVAASSLFFISSAANIDNILPHHQVIIPVGIA